MTEPGLRLIKRLEGFRTEAYPDPGAILLAKFKEGQTGYGEPWTIGFGTTVYSSGAKVKKGDVITEEKASAELIAYVDKKCRPVLEKIPGWANMNDTMRGALESFAYNMGAGFYGAVDCETITRILANQEWEKVPDAMLLYRNGGLLDARRATEGAAWSVGLRQLSPASTKAVVWASGKLKDFFRYYDPKNPNHVAAVDLLEKNLPSAAIGDQAPWVLKFRTKAALVPVATPGKILATGYTYYSQLDNRPGQEDRSCLSATLASILERERPGTLRGSNPDDWYLGEVLAGGDTTDCLHQAQVITRLGLPMVFVTNLTVKQLIQRLKKNKGTAVGVLHHGVIGGELWGGHYMTCIGALGTPEQLAKDEATSLVFNDPYGEANQVAGTYDTTKSGKGIVYSVKNWQQRFEANGPGSGWGFVEA